MKTLKANYTPNEISFVRSEMRKKKLLSRFAFLIRFMGRIGRHFNYWEEILNVFENDKKQLTRANIRPEKLEEVGYRGDKEVATFLSYKSQLYDEYRFKNSEAETLYEVKNQWLSEFLSNESNGVDSVFNFGVCYAYIDYILAEKFPDIKFLGIDRSPITKVLNELEFSNSPNMEFIADDIWEYLNDKKFSNGVFLHARTMLLFNRPLVEDIYELAAKSGFKFIIGFEQFGISRDTLEEFSFDHEPKNSAYYRGGMFTHNYPYLLEKFGYKIKRADIIKTNHPHPDYRFFAFIAERIKN